MNAAAESVISEPPLIVDLDGTLIRTDLLVESALQLLKTQPWSIVLMLWWLLNGKARLKAEIARRVDLDASVLPYNEPVLQRIREERRQGRSVWLATASNRKYASQVASHLGVFDDTLASDDRDNLRGAGKLRAIRARLGDGEFDYIGNDAHDLKLWRHSRKALVTNASAGIVRAVRKLPCFELIGSVKGTGWKTLLRAMRIHQWLKNLLLFVPLFAGHKVSDVTADFNVVLGFLAFGLCASSVYLLNDLLDMEADRSHPIKRERPLASGEMSATVALTMIPLLLASSAAIAIWLPTRFVQVLAVYFAVTVTYSFWAKRQLMLDVIVLAGLYTLRVIAGAAAAKVALSFWLLALSMFIFLSLALVKRYSEILLLAESKRTKAAGRGYEHGDLSLLQSMGTASGYLSVIVIALYINSPEVRQLYSQPTFLWAVCPLLLLWISWVWMKAHRGQMHHDPVVFAIKDPTSALLGALCAVSVLLASR